MHQACRALFLLCVTPVVAQRPATSLDQHLHAAQQAQAAQDCHTAAREYGLAARMMPKSGELSSNYGVALYCDGQLTPAVAAFRRALMLNPALAAPHLFLGLGAYRVGDHAEAARELQTLLRLNPSDKVAHLWLGYTYVAEEHYPEAIHQFEDVLALDPKDMDAQYALGQSWLEEGRQAARALETLAPKGWFLMQLVGEQDELVGDTVRAQAAFQEAAKRREAAPAGAQQSDEQQQVLYQRAHEAASKAQAAFEAVMREAPDSYRAHQIMADIALARGQDDEALAEYSKVLQQNPDLPGVHESRSNCFMRQARFTDALAELKAEQRLQPRSARVSTEMARVQLDLGDAKGAIVSLDPVLRAANPPAEAYVLFGKATLRTGDAPAAQQALKTAIAKDPNLPLAYYLLARAYRETGNRADMAIALQNYRRTSQDEQERQVAMRAVQNPNAPPPVMQAEDLRDARELTSSGP